MASIVPVCVSTVSSFPSTESFEFEFEFDLEFDSDSFTSLITAVFSSFAGSSVSTTGITGMDARETAGMGEGLDHRGENEGESRE